MTPKQKNLLLKLFLGNLIVYAILAIFVFKPPLPQLADLIALLPSRVPSQAPTPKPLPTPTRLPSTIPTVLPKPTIRVVRASVPTLLPQPNPSGATGANPASPLVPINGWQTLSAGSSVWYVIGDGGVHMDVAMQAKPLDGVTFEVYAPAQLDQPIGHGTYQTQTDSLVWAGGQWQANGNWLARILNRNPMAVQYKFTSSAKDIHNKSCRSYWETLGGSPVYWTVCE